MCVCHARSQKTLLSAVRRTLFILLRNYLNLKRNITLSSKAELISINTNFQLNYHHRRHYAVHFSLHFTPHKMKYVHNKTHVLFFPPQ